MCTVLKTIKTTNLLFIPQLLEVIVHCFRRLCYYSTIMAQVVCEQYFIANA